jgi:hypothetical protein
MAESGEPVFTIPISANNIYGFCFWAGRTEGKKSKQEIGAKTIEKYIHGLKSWHLLHGAKYPDLVEPTVKILLQSSAKADALVPLKEKKGAVHLKHLVFLVKALVMSNPKGKAVLDLALVAFWGMAHLGELTSPYPHGDLDPRTSVFKDDVSWEKAGDETLAVLTLQDAKTCKPGETQKIKLRPLTNLLCPVEAVKKRLTACRKFGLPTLFSYSGIEWKQFTSLRTLSSKRLARFGSKVASKT